MLMIGEMNLADAAKEAAGNWKKLNSFVWHRESQIEKPEDWTISYTHHRDSGLLDLSNAAFIEKELQRFTEGDDPSVVLESHMHWAVGHLDGISIRVYRNGQITEAFKAFYKIKILLSGYPVLDGLDYSRREYEATIDNIKTCGWQYSQKYDLPGDWHSQVYDWLAENLERSIVNVDDHGGWPDESEILTAFDGLGFVHDETD